MSRRLSNSRFLPGIGYIIVPSNVSRDKYVETCYRKERVSILIENGGGVVHDCLITRETLREIFFPKAFKDQGKVLLGSPVVFISSLESDIPIIIGVFSNGGENLDVKENVFSFKKVFGENTVSISGNAEEAIININVIGHSDVSRLNINVVNVNETAELTINVAGKVTINSTGTAQIYAPIIKFGKKDFEELVLGQKNKDVLKEIKDLLSSLDDTISNFATTQEGVSTTTSLLPLKTGYMTLISKIASEKTKLSKLITDIDKTLSKTSSTQ
jgi:hypothetical protein